MSLETDFQHRERRKKMAIGFAILGVFLLLALLMLIIQNPIG